MAIQDASSPAISTGSPNVILTNVACDPTVYVGAWVRMDGTGTAYNALADSMANSNVIGLCEAKVTSTLCNIRVSGISEAIYTGLDVTKNYYLSPTVAGGHQTTAPSVTGQIRLALGQPFSAIEMFPFKGERVQVG
jgi:hypothetical protein